MDEQHDFGGRKPSARERRRATKASLRQSARDGRGRFAGKKAKPSRGLTDVERKQLTDFATKIAANSLQVMNAALARAKR